MGGCAVTLIGVVSYGMILFATATLITNYASYLRDSFKIKVWL